MKNFPIHALLLPLLPLLLAVQGTPDVPVATSGSSQADIPSSFKIAITLDDLPWVGQIPPDGKKAANKRVLATLSEHHVPATGFVVCDRAEEEPGILGLWQAAGMDLGNHQAGHDNINKVPEDQWMEGVRRCDAFLKKQTGQPVRFFRYPYLYNGPTPEIRDRVLHVLTSEYHYTIARVSVDNLEWKLGELYGKALQAHDEEKASGIAQFYPGHMLDAVHHFQEVAVRKVGHDVSHVILLHDNALNADHVGDMLSRLEGAGATFVPLSEALADPVYALPNAYDGKWGISWLHRIAPADTERPWDDAVWKEVGDRFGGN